MIAAATHFGLIGASLRPVRALSTALATRTSHRELLAGARCPSIASAITGRRALSLPCAGRTQAASAETQPTLSSLGALALGTKGPVLWLAPLDPGTALPPEVIAVLPTASRRSLAHFITHERPSTMVIDDQCIDAALLALWRTQCPRQDLSIQLRHASSGQEVDRSACLEQGVRLLMAPDDLPKRPELGDAAVLRALECDALESFFAGLLADPDGCLQIPTGVLPVGGPKVQVVGSGVTALFAALMLRRLNYEVGVHGHKPSAEGPATVFVTHAAPPHPAGGDPCSAALLQRQVHTLHAAGMAMLGRFLQQNDEFRSVCREGVSRAVPDGETADMQRLVQEIRSHGSHRRPTLAGRGVAPIASKAFGSMLGGVVHAFEFDGYTVDLRAFQQLMAKRLEASGVRFLPEPLQGEGSDAGAACVPVIRMTPAHQGSSPGVQGWRLQMPAGGNEGTRAMLLHCKAPLGTIKCWREAQTLVVEGGHVAAGLSEKAQTRAKALLLQAVESHFPQSFAAAQGEGRLDIKARLRPSEEDGLAPMAWVAHDQLLCAVPGEAGLTQAAPRAALAVHLLRQSRQANTQEACRG